MNPRGMILILASVTLFNACASTASKSKLSGETIYLDSPPSPPEIQKPPPDTFLQTLEETTQLETQLAAINLERQELKTRLQFIRGLRNWQFTDAELDKTIDRLIQEEAELKKTAPNSNELHQAKQRLHHFIEAVEFGKEIEEILSYIETKYFQLSNQAAELEQKIAQEKAKL